MSGTDSSTGSVNTRTNVSNSSKKSSSSSANIAATKARAKAEAARAEAGFAAKENELKLKQAELEASTQLTVHVNYPEDGLRAIWDQLDEYYGAPEVIESSLFKRLENFPKIQNKDGRKLRELGDLLLEIQAAKADGDLLGLNFLDTSRGVNPVIAILPAGKGAHHRLYI